MRRSAWIVVLLLAACGEAMGNDNGATGLGGATLDPDSETAQQIAATRRLQAILEAGPGDPAGDARRAAAAGNFRLIWGVAMAGRGVIGPNCRFPDYAPPGNRTPLVLVQRIYSDVIGSCESFGSRGANACLLDQQLDAYAPVYNRTLVADPHFPYADLCEGNAAQRPSQGPSLQRPETLAAATRRLTDAPRTLGEAARRGSPASVSRLLNRLSPEALDRRDDFGLTPLAWAAIERRPDIAALLMTRGADPIAGANGPANDYRGTPLLLALGMGQHALADAMLTPDVVRRLQPWRGAIFAAAIRGDHVALVRRMLREPNEIRSTAQLLAQARREASPAMAQAIIEGGENPGQAMLEVAINQGDPVLLRRALATRPSLAPARNDRHSPLGNAVLQGSPRVDELVQLLLRAGAAADSPADWARNGYPTGSTPPTALLALVALADRIHPGRQGRAEPEADARRAAQRRTLDLLLAAGASVRARDSYDRPLAVLAVTGHYDPRGMRTRAELPAGWLSRLARAGMDVNATWLGSTALDYADALGMADSATARELIRLGGRRVKRADLSGGSHF